MILIENLESDDVVHNLPLMPGHRTIAAVGQNNSTTPVNMAQLAFGQNCLERAMVLNTRGLWHMMEPPPDPPYDYERMPKLTDAETLQLTQEQREHRQHVRKLRQRADKIVLLVFKRVVDAKSFVGMRVEQAGMASQPLTMWCGLSECKLFGQVIVYEYW
jgi:hypothetical protein